MDLYLVLLMVQVIGHLYVLKEKLKNMLEYENDEIKSCTSDEYLKLAPETFDDKQNKKIQNELNGVIEHHKYITEFTNNVADTFGPMLAINYLCHLVVCCLCLLELSQGDPQALTQYGPVTVIVFGQLILISVIFEVVTTVSERLEVDLYLIPWERMNKQNRRTFCLFLYRVQKPIIITAMGMAPVGVKTMAKILKTTFSYFTFLMSIDS